MVDEAVIDFLHLIEQPALIIFGENDNLIPNRFLNPGPTIDVARVGEELLPNNQLHMIPGCGHFVQFEASDEFNRIVREFLGK